VARTWSRTRAHGGGAGNRNPNVKNAPREQVRRLFTYRRAEDSRGCRSTSLTPRILFSRERASGLSPRWMVSKTSRFALPSDESWPSAPTTTAVHTRVEEEGARVKLEFSSRALL